MLLELDGRGPRYGQMTRALLKAIGDGTLSPGARVPSTRRLARDLGCARNIVILAYEEHLPSHCFRLYGLASLPFPRTCSMHSSRRNGYAIEGLR
jgi:hypothetical protein